MSIIPPEQEAAIADLITKSQTPEARFGGSLDGKRVDVTHGVGRLLEGLQEQESEIEGLGQENDSLRAAVSFLLGVASVEAVVIVGLMAWLVLR